MKKWTALLCSFSLFLFCFGSASAFDKLVVFGDSLSDLGFQDHLGPVIGESPLWTSPGGETWPFYLAHNLKIATITVNNSTTPNEKNKFVSTLGAGNDYAAGGATTDGQGIGSTIYAPPSIHAQVNNYIEKHARDHKYQTLYILWGGANDIFMALSASSSSADPAAVVMAAAKKAADNISDYAKLLKMHGARHIIVVNLPDLGQTPLAQKQQAEQPGMPALLSAATDTFNQELMAMLMNKVEVFDIKTVFNAIRVNKKIAIGDKLFGFSNVLDPACEYDVDKGIASISALNCVPPARAGIEPYLFEDGLHPTDAGHQVVAAELAQFIQQKNRWHYDGL